MDVPNVLVLFTDGKSYDHIAAVQAAQQLKAGDVAILCVAIGKGATSNQLIEQLTQLASKPEYVFKSNINALNAIENELVRKICISIRKYTTKKYMPLYR